MVSVLACEQLYTVSQDGTLCVWESDTELDGLVLARPQDKDRTEGQKDGEADVIRGNAVIPEDQRRNTVRYKQVSKYGSCRSSDQTRLTVPVVPLIRPL